MLKGAKSHNRKAVAKKELLRLIELQKSASAVAASDAVIYGRLKRYTNFVERMGRKYRVSPVSFEASRKSGRLLVKRAAPKTRRFRSKTGAALPRRKRRVTTRSR